MSYGWVVAVVGLIVWIVGGRWFYLPRFKRFVLTLKEADPATWIAFGSPDGSMFGSSSTPAWGIKTATYLWLRKYKNESNEDLRLASEEFRTAFTAVHIGLVTWLLLVMFLAMTNP
jgi:hypothetical protein